MSTGAMAASSRLLALRFDSSRKWLPRNDESFRMDDHRGFLEKYLVSNQASFCQADLIDQDIAEKISSVMVGSDGKVPHATIQKLECAIAMASH